MMRRLFVLFRPPARPAAGREDPVAQLVKLIAALSIVIVVLISMLSHPKQNVLTSLGNLGTSLLPNIAVLLLAYLVVSIYLDRRGMSPQQRLVSKIVSEVTASVKPVKGIRSLHSLITQTPYGEAFMKATEVQMVGRSYNETLRHYPEELRAFLKQDGRVKMVLMDVGNSTTVEIAAQQSAGQPEIGRSYIDEAIYKATSTITTLYRACRAAGVEFEQAVSIYVYPQTMNYWGIRFRCGEDVDDLYFAPYDNFRNQTLACPTVVFDLKLSVTTLEFWEAEFKAFVAGSLSFHEWVVRQTCEDIQRALASDDPLVEPLKLDLPWVPVEIALASEGFQLSTCQRVDGTTDRRMTLEHATGRNLEVLVNAENWIVQATLTSAMSLAPGPKADQTPA